MRVFIKNCFVNLLGVLVLATCLICPLLGLFIVLVWMDESSRR